MCLALRRVGLGQLGLCPKWVFVLYFAKYHIELNANLLSTAC